MPYSSLRDCVTDLEQSGRLVIIKDPVEPRLEMAAIQRRVNSSGGPALYFAQVKGSPFPAVSNLYGTLERMQFIFRHSLEAVQKVVALKGDPTLLLQRPIRYVPTVFTAFRAFPKRARFHIPVAHSTTDLSKLPQIVSWVGDGGAFITLPQVITLPPGIRQLMQANLGMYRIQISGNEYEVDKEAGMHYQIHRGIGVHHAMYNERDEPFRVSIFVGGPPAHTLAAIMPLPEGLSELTFAGMLGGRRFRYTWRSGYVLSADADFCITGTIMRDVKKPEGPFGDHLGYYSLKHDFPVLKVDTVYHRKDPIWHFTVVGRPPQEDSSFGHLIHEIAGPLLPKEFPGIREVNAVDASGVHPLLLAIGSERYMPFRDRRPEEILTQANHLLGKGQTSLAKYLLIAAGGDDPQLTTKDIPAFLHFILSRFDPTRDLHFQTKTTIDTLDYSGTGLNEGSKLVIAVCGAPKRILSHELPQLNYPSLVKDVVVVAPGILALSGPTHQDDTTTQNEVAQLESSIDQNLLRGFPLIILVDDARFVAASFNNFLWVTFTRSNPSHDVYGFGAFTDHKHWGCKGPLVIDARIKSHHAPVLEEDPETLKKIERHFMKGGALHGY